MRFQISRTSQWLTAADNPPCDNATRGILEDREGWIVEMESLSDLITFAAEYGPLMITVGTAGPSLEIYDDYREC